MRIALITSQAFSLTNFRGPLIVEMVARGISVYAFAPDFDAQSRQAVSQLGAVPVTIHLSRTGMNPLRDGFATLRLALLLRRLKIDVSLAYFIKPVIFGTLAAALARVPQRYCLIEGLGYVFTAAAGTMPTRRRLLRTLVSGMYRWSLKLAHQVFLLNPDDAKELVAGGMVATSKITTLDGIGIDLQTWAVVPLPQSRVCFMLAARLLREKGIVEYVQAAKIVKLRYPNTRFLLLGAVDPNPGSLTQAQVSAWVAEGLVEWPGHVPVRPWLAQASVYVLPSYREGLPRSTQEAMAMGRPIITTDAPGCRETVVEGLNGFLIPVRDPSALADRMLHLIESPALMVTMGQASRVMAEQRFDVHQINRTILKTMGLLHERT